MKKLFFEAPEINDPQIRQLREEAATAGDLAQVQVCDLALRGNEGARQRCVDAILEARAQEG